MHFSKDSRKPADGDPESEVDFDAATEPSGMDDECDTGVR